MTAMIRAAQRTTMASTTAFQDLAAGDFERGLRKLGEDACWRDSNGTLDGPFRLKFPRTPGWGEALLVASLLKRHAAHVHQSIEVLAPPEVQSILQHDPAFRVRAVGESEPIRLCEARPPLAVLRHALTGSLLDREFVPLSVEVNWKVSVTTNPRIGIAWESVGRSNDAIGEKSIPCEDFLNVLDGLDVELITFQRRLRPAHREQLLSKFAHCSFLSDDALDAPDQTEIVREVRSLDCMVTISTTTAHMAACLGIPVVLMAAQRQGPQWFWRAQKEHGKCIYPSVQPLLGRMDVPNRWWQSCLAIARSNVQAILDGRGFRAL